MKGRLNTLTCPFIGGNKIKSCANDAESRLSHRRRPGVVAASRCQVAHDV
jgi:hypothetical protein